VLGAEIGGRPDSRGAARPKLNGYLVRAAGQLIGDVSA
jgi:hypothetical protein